MWNFVIIKYGIKGEIFIKYLQEIQTKSTTSFNSAWFYRGKHLKYSPNNQGYKHTNHKRKTSVGKLKPKN